MVYPPNSGDSRSAGALRHGVKGYFFPGADQQLLVLFVRHCSGCAVCHACCLCLDALRDEGEKGRLLPDPVNDPAVNG